MRGTLCHAVNCGQKFIMLRSYCLESEAVEFRGLLDTHFLCQYKNAMKKILRLLLGLGLAAVILSCNIVPSRPSLPFLATATASLVPTPTATLTPTPVPTPVPLVRVANGDQALFDGDVDTAAADYRTAFNESNDPQVKAAALWGLARTQAADGHHVDTLTTLAQLISDYPNSPYVPAAYFLQGQTYNDMQRYAEAAAAYQQYLNARPGVLDSYVQELRGDALTSANDYSDALIAYNAAQAAPHLDDGQALLIKIAQTRAQIGDYATALSMYSAIAANTTNDYIRSQMDYLTGEADLKLNKNEEAYNAFRHAVQNYPLSYYSYLSLVELVNAKAQVSDLDRGLVDYFAGQYSPALAALQRYIAAAPNDDGTAHYYLALTQEALQNYPQALNELDYFIKNYPANQHWSDAWNEKATIQWQDQNLYPDAAATLETFARSAPTPNDSAEALMTAARLLEEDGRFDEAAQVWVQVGTNYPGYDLAPTAVFFAGIMQYRQADYNAALPLFQRSLSQASTAEDQARAYLWIGKTEQKLGKTAETQTAWQQAQNLDPGGYYSERARDLLLGQAPFTPPPASNLKMDLAAERKAADTWMKLTFNLPSDTDLNGLGPLASDPRVIRGTELWNLGQYEDARLEFEDLRNSLTNDAVGSYRLGNYMIDMGLYRSGIFALRQVLTLAGLTDNNSSMLAPTYFSHARYGLYYSDVIIPAAQAYGLDPLFLFAVVRQESLFEGFVSSTAGARGLMQIVPSTGMAISGQVNWPPYFDPSLLYRPKVSVVYGAYYLAANRKLLGGDLYGALAAYNGGPANASDWEKLSQGDPDLMLESIRFSETRQYIQNIYEMYVVYKRLYGSGS
jgi:soluble lytic murein transglycosylase